jgi:hypothetical protein
VLNYGANFSEEGKNKEIFRLFAGVFLGKTLNYYPKEELAVNYVIFS